MQSKIEYVATNSIKGAKFQPGSRSEKGTRLNLLRKNIERAGGILVPLVVKDGHLVDGHRRLAVAKQLGYETVPVVQVNGTLTPEALFGNLNTGTKPLNATESMQAVAKGFPVEELAGNTRHCITQIVEWVGQKGLKELVAHNRSPRLAQTVMQIGHYCDIDNAEFRAKTLMWLDEHTQSFAVRMAIANNCPPKTIVSAINANRPLKKNTNWN